MGNFLKSTVFSDWKSKALSHKWKVSIMMMTTERQMIGGWENELIFYVVSIVQRRWWCLFFMTSSNPTGLSFSSVLADSIRMDDNSRVDYWCKMIDCWEEVCSVTDVLIPLSITDPIIQSTAAFIHIALMTQRSKLIRNLSNAQQLLIHFDIAR